MEDIGKIARFVLIGIVLIYVAFLLISEFSKITPEFAVHGWYIFGALVMAFVGGMYLIFRK